MGDVAAHHLDRSRRRPEVAGNEIEERRLARPVGPENRTALAVRDVQIDVAYGVDAAEPRPTPRRRRIGSAVSVASVKPLLDDAVDDRPFLAGPRQLVLLARWERASWRRGAVEHAAECRVDIQDIGNRHRGSFPPLLIIFWLY